MAGLLARERTGRGQKASTSLFANALAMQCMRLAQVDGMPSPAQRWFAEEVPAKRANGVTYDELQDEYQQLVRPHWYRAYYRAYRTKDGGLALGTLAVPARLRLLKYMNHDDQHLSRIFDAVPAAYLACDPLNRDRLLTRGGQSCLRLNIYPLRTRPNTGGWGSLHDVLRGVKRRPGQGVGYDRAHGWLTHTLGWAFFLSQDKQTRADCVAVAKADVAVRATAQMSGGNVTLRPPFAKAFRGKYWFTTGWEEGAIMASGAKAVVAILSSTENAKHAQTMKDVYARSGRWTATKGWDQKSHSPGFHIGLKPKGATEFLDDPVTTGSTSFYMGTPMAWYYELTGEQIFLDRLKEMAGNRSIARRAMGDLGNWSYALWLAQGGKIPGRTVQKDN